MDGLVVTLMIVVTGCSGPWPLSVAVRPADKEAYLDFLRRHPESPREAFFAWKASYQGESVERVRQSDAEISTTKNPFDAHKDFVAVGRGAVVYAAHCVSCHGENADGRGPMMPEPTPKMDFHAFGKRFASTLHRGAPRAWFKKISEGFTSEHLNADGSQSKMPAMGDALAREQVWLTITYLQSLDIHAPRRPGGNGS